MAHRREGSMVLEVRPCGELFIQSRRSRTAVMGSATQQPIAGQAVKGSTSCERPRQALSRPSATYGTRAEYPLTADTDRARTPDAGRRIANGHRP